MKKRTLTLLLALVMALALGLNTFAEETATQAPAQDPVLATVLGKDILKSAVDAQIPGMLQNQYIADATDYMTVITMMVRHEILQKKIADMGMNQFTAQEEEAFANEAQQQWDAEVSSFADYYQSANSAQAREDAVLMAEQTLAGYGYSIQGLQDNLRAQAGIDRMEDHLMGGYEPGEEEIQKVFNEFGAMYQQNYGGDIAQYEYLTQYLNQPSWYTPEGYRGVIHILLSPDEAIFNEYKTLLAGFEEQQQASEVPVEESGEGSETAQPTAEPAPESTPITQEMVDKARQAVMDSRKADIDMIYQRLERGESFVDLVREYGEDPGMTDETNLANGYAVHAQSILYDPVFTAAAFQDKVQKVGDVSDPVVGSFGIHIVQYLRDVPSGLIMTDAIHQEIHDYLMSIKSNEVFGAAFAQWENEIEVVYHQEAIDSAIAEASQNVQSQEELPLEVVPGTED